MRPRGCAGAGGDAGPAGLRSVGLSVGRGSAGSERRRCFGGGSGGAGALRGPGTSVRPGAFEAAMVAREGEAGAVGSGAGNAALICAAALAADAGGSAGLRGGGAGLVSATSGGFGLSDVDGRTGFELSGTSGGAGFGPETT